MKQTNQPGAAVKQALTGAVVKGFARADGPNACQKSGTLPGQSVNGTKKTEQAAILWEGGRALPQLAVNERAKVVAIRDRDRRIETRLRDIGFSEGSEVVCVGRSPLGDPTAFAVRGAVIALRAEDAACVLVEERKERGRV